MNYIRTLAEIAFFKGKPHDIAYNSTYLILSFTTVLLIGIAAGSAVGKISNPIYYILVQFGILGIFFYLLLLANNKASRFIQSASALYGIIALSQVCAYFFVFILKISNFAIFFYLWAAVVQIYIFRETLECKTLKAVALFAGIQFSTNLILLALFPELVELLQNSVNQSTQTNS